MADEGDQRARHCRISASQRAAQHQVQRPIDLARAAAQRREQEMLGAIEQQLLDQATLGGIDTLLQLGREERDTGLDRSARIGAQVVAADRIVGDDGRHEVELVAERGAEPGEEIGKRIRAGQVRSLSRTAAAIASSLPWSLSSWTKICSQAPIGPVLGSLSWR